MRLSPWGRVVAISALLVVGGAAALAVGAIASSKPRLVTYPVTGTVEGLAFDVADGDIVIVGGGDSIDVRRSERYSFGHAPATERTVDGAVLRVRSRCPTSLLGPCSVSYRVTVPDNVALDIRTTSGDVSLRGYRGSARIATGSGAIGIAGYCGNSLDARVRLRRHRRSTPRALPRGCRCAPRRARSTRRCRPAATTSTPRAAPGARPCTGSRHAPTRPTPSRS